MCDSSKALIVSVNIEQRRKAQLGFLKETKFSIFVVKEKTCGKVPKENECLREIWEPRLVRTHPVYYYC